jgi:site-specific DNA-methyltransferase (adenine-specific)/modification methylase
MSRIEQFGHATLYLGDSREMLPLVGNADVVVTDPPYGVNLGEYTGTSRYRNTSYGAFSDTEEYVRETCVPVIRDCLTISKRLAMTPGHRCMWLYPKPDDVGIWYNPASTNRGRWGFSYTNAFIFFYGKDPKNVGRGMIPNSLSGACDPVGHIEHPCPKPLKFAKWLVDRASLDGDVVLDPFMGSGTTGVAALQLGRKFIGIEIDPTYFDVACRRVEAAERQKDLLHPPEMTK